MPKAVGALASYKKADLVNSPDPAFRERPRRCEPTPAQQKAREWLPDAMLFPAVDPDAAAEAEEEPEWLRGRMRPDPMRRGGHKAAAPLFRMTRQFKGRKRP